MTGRRCLAQVLLFCALAGAFPVFGSDDAPELQLAPAVGPAVDWLAEDRDGILVGSGTQVYGAALGERPALEERFSVYGSVTSAVTVGRQLLLVINGRRVGLADPETSEQRALGLDSPSRGRLTPAVLGSLLVFAEDGVGLRLLQISPGRHGGPLELTPISRLPLVETFTAVAASVRMAYVATESGMLFEIDVAAPTAPRIVRVTRLDEPVHALAANNDRVHALGPAGLTTYALEGHRLAVQGRSLDVRGESLQIHGRLIYVGGPAGIQVLRDRTEGGSTHTVAVGNNFFSPANIVIDVNDSVQWTNHPSGGAHNVQSCVPSIDGCNNQTATQAFTSGSVAGPPWIYTFQFTELGENPYVCIAHIPDMNGSVTVGDAISAKIPIPFDVGVPTMTERPRVLRVRPAEND